MRQAALSPPSSASHYQPIENYGVIGNLQTVALVGMDGAIDFLSFPYFDSPTVFAALLDDARGGRFALAPLLDGARHRQLYLSDSNILISRFLSADGVAEVSDFMPIALEPDSTDKKTEAPHRLVRRARCVRGEIKFRLRCQPRFNYGRAQHKVETRAHGRQVLFLCDDPAHPLTLRLHSTLPLRHDGHGAAVAEFTLRAGEHAAFVLEEVQADQARAPGNNASHEFVAAAFKATLNFWQRWLARSTYKGRWREMVDRSALVLKLLTSQKYGSIVAAPTFGLPEFIGGTRNWDYRYTWIRDASFTLYGLSRLGFYEEAGAFMRWLEARCAELPDGGALQIMYGIDGRAKLTEEELPDFEGYRGSRPVRYGNAAYGQRQLDIYGELMDSVYIYNKFGTPISNALWLDLTRLIDWVCEHWREPDEGIWEVRGGQQEFLYSRIMCWVALDRAVRLAQKRSFPAPLARWMRERDRIYRDIYDNFWDARQAAFTQTKGGRTIDASCLLMPLIKFISPRDPRWLSTLCAVERELVDDSLVYRYKGADGIPGREGTFCMCSFWYVEALARSGDVRQARYIMDKLLGYANHLGLYAEELGPAGEHLGNFPQAFTHLALISAAYALDHALDEPGREH